MPLGVLQHFTIEPSDLERTKAFYCDVLGLENGDRPPLGFPGYWLYSGGVPTVHLLGPRKPREGIVVRGTICSRNFTLLDCRRLRTPGRSLAAKAIWSKRPVSSYFFSVPRTTMPSRGTRGPSRCTVATPPE